MIHLHNGRLNFRPDCCLPFAGNDFAYSDYKYLSSLIWFLSDTHKTPALELLGLPESDDISIALYSPICPAYGYYTMTKKNHWTNYCFLEIVKFDHLDRDYVSCARDCSSSSGCNGSRRGNKSSSSSSGSGLGGSSNSIMNKGNAFYRTCIYFPITLSSLWTIQLPRTISVKAVKPVFETTSVHSTCTIIEVTAELISGSVARPLSSWKTVDLYKI